MAGILIEAGKRIAVCFPHAECYEVSFYIEYIRIRVVSSRQVLQVLGKVSEKVPEGSGEVVGP